MIVGFFGLSGVGKTHLIKRLVSNTDEFIQISASKLIKSEGGVIQFENLNRRVLLDNQNKLVSSIQKLKSEKKNYLIEMHTILETKNYIFTVPDIILNQLRDVLDLAFFLQASPQFIRHNRLMDSKTRAIKTDLELAEAQELSLFLFKKSFPECQFLVIDHSFDMHQLQLSISNLR
ncbi:AAA family ATPase [Thorsellia anophelis]|uniref:Adenylate kinase n=1 Tax=Thorsellia anophelis DSM 18579 TaxID=1123402 RepID=A0A1I0AT24_9GAMM|nr:AAA family ATPase [Thorsellia anophelis]SES97552.1 adenylate kinase [Thorsellia anophelis DSM 18579]